MSTPERTREFDGEGWHFVGVKSTCCGESMYALTPRDGDALDTICNGCGQSCEPACAACGTLLDSVDGPHECPDDLPPGVTISETGHKVIDLMEALRASLARGELTPYYDTRIPPKTKLRDAGRQT